jgi:RecB family exonuclease
VALAHPGTVVVVPTRAAAIQLARLLDLPAAREAILATRDELYEVLRLRLSAAPRWLTDVERDVIAQSAARRAAAHGGPRRLRPGLVAEMLRFYDLLRRQSQQVQRFEELIVERLESQLELDPGAQRMLEQTRFLAATFGDYERIVRASGKCDEHVLRDRLISEAADDPVKHIVVSVPDWIADPDGLFVADFDLLSRIAGLETLDVVVTESILASGFHERLHNWWPGVEEAPAADVTGEIEPRKPFLITPGPDELWTTVRDRHEELVDVARRVVGSRSGADSGRVAVVYKRPLPYVYLAPVALGAAGIPFETVDALPLAGEPVSAALDLLIEFAANGFTRADAVALLRSPHFFFESGGFELTRRSVAALDRELSDRRYLGEFPRLEDIAAVLSEPARAAAEVLLAAARSVVPLLSADPASSQAERLASAFERLLRPLDEGEPFAGRERHTREILLAGIRALGSAHAAHDDASWTIDELAPAVRRWVETQTIEPRFEPPGGADRTAAVVLLDDRAARYGEFDDMTIVGLIEGDWPERSRRNIFYGSSLMKALGWPSERDRRAADESRFLDLMASPAHSVSLSTFTLEDEALVEPSALLHEAGRARLSTVARSTVDADRRSERGAPDPLSTIPRIYPDEALSIEPIELAGLADTAARWARIRLGRSPQGDSSFHGRVDAPRPRPWSISAVETYLGCPFRFFAQHILRLEEEPEDAEVMDPRAQGEFVHHVFEEFFDAWQASGRAAITPDNLDDARVLFAEIVDTESAALRPAEAGLERTRLLGSPVAGGLGEAVLRMEAERPARVIERLLEHKFEGEFTIQTERDSKRISLKGKADRIDLLDDGTFRLIDYKLGWPPDRRKALQLPIYSLCAEQRLEGRHGRHWQVGEAVYLAFKGPRRVVPLFTASDSRNEILASAQQRLADALDAIARGEFPPKPDDVHRCETCAFAAVCRKDYVGDV